MRIRGEIIHVNPMQLFHRMLCTVRSDEELAEYLTFELAARPPALFDDFSLRKGTKSTLLKPLKKLVPPEVELPVAVASYILMVVFASPCSVDKSVDIWTDMSEICDLCQRQLQCTRSHSSV